MGPKPMKMKTKLIMMELVDLKKKRMDLMMDLMDHGGGEEEEQDEEDDDDDEKRKRGDEKGGEMCYAGN
ncbi:unnamed protein product [Fusarium graminearum]|nr:unnamed protein product [Fusarium graminearum]